MDVGAAVWGSGATGVSGPIGVGNSIHGVKPGDKVGEAGVEALANGNYVVSSPHWDSATADVGAVTWASGGAPTSADVTVGNSLHGTTANDLVGNGGATALKQPNGAYVVLSRGWSNGAAVGAATRLPGDAASNSAVTTGNSLYGGAAGDFVQATVTALENGNYVVATPAFNGNRGAATWGNGAAGVTGVVAAGISLVGTATTDQVGSEGVTALSNGNYVVNSPEWTSPTHMFAGAATWGNGGSGIAGPVSATNSLIGDHDGDRVGKDTIALEVNDNYVVYSQSWNGGRGSVTWGNGATGLANAVVSATNSLVGDVATDQVGSSGILALTQGNYVVLSPNWKNGTATSAGAATWGDGSTAGPRLVGLITPTNSLVGTSMSDQIGYNGNALDDGNYVTYTQYWNLSATETQVGAVTWGNGSTGISGPVSATNSLVGSRKNDHLSDFGVRTIPTGLYAVASVSFQDPALVVVGAVTFGGPGGVVGPLTPANSLIGTVLNDGGNPADHLSTDGSFVVGRATKHLVTLWKDTNLVPDYIPLPPARLADTRANGVTTDGQFQAIGKQAAGSTLQLTVAGRGGVPANALAATLNVTATEADADGFLTVFPCGAPQPTASNVNYAKGGTIPNAVVTKLGDSGANTGKVCIFTQNAVHLVVDVNGAFPPTTSYKALNPARLLDTRPGQPTVDAQQQGQGAVGPASVSELLVAGRGGVPADATAVVLNVTVTQPAAPGFATVYPCGTAAPTASNLNYVTNLTIPNLVIAKVGTGGKVCIFAQQSTHLVADVVGYFPVATSFSALVPARLLDTRPGFATIDAQGAGANQQPTGTITKVHVAGRGGVPANATTAVLNVTVTEPVADGFVTVFPCGITAPLASNLNFAAGQTIPNAVIAKIGTDGDVCILNSQPTQLIADVTGYFG
jgi:hypothetical protein